MPRLQLTLTLNLAHPWWAFDLIIFLGLLSAEVMRKAPLCPVEALAHQGCKLLVPPVTDSPLCCRSCFELFLGYKNAMRFLCAGFVPVISLNTLINLNSF